MKTPKPVQVEFVGYPCGCSRRVDINHRGWNYCPTHEQYYSAHQISITPTRTAVEQAEPVHQIPFAPFVGQDGAVCEKLF